MSKAIDLYKEAAEEGDPSSMCVLGTYYMNGVQEGDNVLIEGNAELANYYIGKAHQARVPQATYLLGVFNHHGFGMVVNKKQALEHYITAGSKGYIEGLYAAALLFNEGDPIAGIPKEEVGTLIY